MRSPRSVPCLHLDSVILALITRADNRSICSREGGLAPGFDLCPVSVLPHQYLLSRLFPLYLRRREACGSVPSSLSIYVTQTRLKPISPLELQATPSGESTLTSLRIGLRQA
jgi:hypothetical protein